jgi:VWFA-related protein
MNDTLEQARETYATIYSVYYNTEGDLYRGAGGPTVGGYPLPGGGLPPVVSGPGVYGPGFPGGAHYEYAAGREYLKRLSEFSGGMVFDGNENLQDAFAQVAKELASQYSIGYYSSNPKHDGKFRKVEVKLNKPGLVARTKKGYTAKKDAKKK